MIFNILICDDLPFLESKIARFLKIYFPSQQTKIIGCNGIPKLRKLLETNQLNCDIAITDINFEETGGSESDGLEILRILKEWNDLIEVILITRYAYQDKRVIDAHRMGMADWIRLDNSNKEILTQCLHCQQSQAEASLNAEFPICTFCGAPLKPSWYELRLTLLRLFEKITLRKELDSERRSRVYYKKMWKGLTSKTTELEPLKTSLGFSEIVGSSKAMRCVYEIVEKLMNLSVPVLITGQTGTGKNLLAKVVHDHSIRKKHGFEIIECANVPENVLESELFGVIKNYPGFHNKDPLPGKIESAAGGTILLNEIGDMPLPAQAKLLSIFDSYEPESGYRVARLGERKPRSVDVRIIVATNADLRGLVAEGRFRKDLYYRIDLLHIHLPALKQRKDDIPLLLNHFIQFKSHQLGCPPVILMDDAVKILCEFEWPGNVRQLNNFVEKLFLSYPESAVNADNKTIQDLMKQSSGIIDSNDDKIWQSILRGEISKTLSELQKQFGHSTTLGIVKKAVMHFSGHWPSNEDCGKFFGGMRSNTFRQRLFSWGYTLSDLKQ